MNTRTKRWGRLAATIICLSLLNVVVISASAQDPTGGSTTTSGSAPAPSNNGDNKTYSSTGLENIVISGGGFSPLTGIIRADALAKLLELFKEQKTSGRSGPDARLLDEVVPRVLQKVDNDFPHVDPGLIRLQVIFASVLADIITGAHPLSSVVEHDVFRDARDPRIRRANLDLYLMARRERGTTDARIPNILVNMLLSNTSEQLIELRDQHHAEYERALQEYYDHLPVRWFTVLGTAGLTVSDRWTETVDATGVDVIGGIDYAASATFGGSTGGGATVEKDFSRAREPLMGTLRELYGIRKLIDTDPDAARQQFSMYLEAVANQYVDLSLKPHVVGRIDAGYTDSGATATSGALHTFHIIPGLSASLLTALLPRSVSPNERIVHSPGIGLMGNVREEAGLSRGSSLRSATRGTLSAWYQPMVPYYHREHVSGDFPAEYQRYVFDHWFYRVGCDVSNKIRDESEPPWRLFVQVRSLPRGDGLKSTLETLKRDVILTVGYGQNGYGDHYVSIRTDFVF